MKKVTRLQVPFVIGKYMGGRYKELGNLIQSFEADRLTIHCDRDTPINLDGELRVAKEVTMEVAREKINFFYPKSLVWTETSEIH